MKNIRLQAVPKKVQARWLPSLHELPPYEQASMRGYSDGWSKAQADCKQQMEEKIKASRAHWDAIAQSLNHFPRELAQKLREQLVTLAFNTARKILVTTPMTREEVAAQVQKMLEEAESSSEVEIQLNPEDLTLLTEEDRASLCNEEFAHLKWSPNPAIIRGGCILRGDFGLIDGRQATRINKLEQVALESIKEPKF